MENPLNYDNLEDGQLKAQFDSFLADTYRLPIMTEEELIAFLEYVYFSWSYYNTSFL